MFKIGVVNLDVSHPLAFAKILEQENRGRYFAVYNDGFRNNDEVEAFIKNYKLDRRCDTAEELAKCTDIGFIQGCNWDKHLNYAETFIKAGKPVFIDKPVVGNLADCKRLEKLVSGGGVVIGSSSMRYAQEICDFLALPAEERGEIINVFGTCGVDEFNYGIHIVEAIGGLLGGGAQNVRFNGRALVSGAVCETFTISFGCGATATYHTLSDVWVPCYSIVTTTKGVFNVNIDVSKIYKALLDRICDFMETGAVTTAPVSLLTESVKIMLAGKISRENGGNIVSLADIPINDPGYDGAAFEKEYASKAAKIYI